MSSVPQWRLQAKAMVERGAFPRRWLDRGCYSPFSDNVVLLKGGGRNAALKEEAEKSAAEASRLLLGLRGGR